MNQDIKYVIVFFLMMLVDYLWGHYIKGLADGKSLKAATFSSLIVLIGAFTTINYVENHWLLIPAAIGGFIGTWFAAKHNKKTNTKK